jgi:dienelactone hydrolase
MNETRRRIDYEVDGVQMVGYFAAGGGSDPAERRPGILVSPPGPGLGEHTKGVVRRLAEAGYAAFGLDYHGHGEIVTDGAEMRRRLQRFMEEPLAIRARLSKALEVLRAQPESTARASPPSAIASAARRCSSSPGAAPRSPPPWGFIAG